MLIHDAKRRRVATAWYPLRMVFLLALLASPAFAELPADPAFRGCDLTNTKFVDTYNDSLAAVRAGDSDKGVRLAQKAVEMQPKCLSALQHLANTLSVRVDPDSVRVAAVGSRLYPDEIQFYLIASFALFTAGEFETSLELARTARKVAPSDVDALASEIRGLVRLGRYDEGYASLDAAVGIPPADLACLRIDVLSDNDRNTEATALREACIPAARSAVTLANLDAQTGKTAELALDGTQILSRAAAIHELLKAERWADAVVALQAALAVESWNSLHHVQLSLCYLQLGRTREAKKELQGLFDAKEWITVYGSGDMSGIVTHGSAQQLELSLQIALSELVSLLIDQGDLESAQVAQTRAEARFGRKSGLIGSSIKLTAATKGETSAWEAAHRAVTSFPTDEYVLEAVGRLAFQFPAGIGAPALDAIAANGSSAARTNTLSGLANGQRHAECVAFAQTLLKVVPQADRTAVRGAAYDCAAMGGDIATMDELALSGTTDLFTPNVMYHAGLLSQAGRYADAEKLALLLVEHAELGTRAYELAGLCMLRTSRIDDALALVNQGKGTALLRFNTSVHLYNAERYPESAAVAAKLSCADLDVPDSIKSCKDLLDAVAQLPK